MQLFKPCSALAPLTSTYPSAADVRRAIKNGGRDARYALARLWLSEGIPYCFRENPATYEALREWIGQRLSVDPKSITLIGSARLGYSLSPKHFGRPFSNESDLDLTIVAVGLFERLKQDFSTWSTDYKSGNTIPNNNTEKQYWDKNIDYGASTLKRGFIDSWTTPLRDSYAATRAVAQTMYLLQSRLRSVNGAPQIKKASARIYKDWSSFANQVTTNLSCIA